MSADPAYVERFRRDRRGEIAAMGGPLFAARIPGSLPP